MEEIKMNNYVLLRGVLHEAPRFSHESREERFYQLSMDICRLSGTVDTIHVIVKEQLLKSLELSAHEKLCVCGELRTFNNKSGVGPRLIISVYAKEIWLENGPDENIIELSGALCKDPNLRTTPMGREICDLMLAVNRRYGRSDYLPCIAWGANARESACWPIGTQVHLSGRIQSRTYTKIVEGIPTDKIAFEVSIIQIHPQEIS